MSERVCLCVVCSLFTVCTSQDHKQIINKNHAQLDTKRLPIWSLSASSIHLVKLYNMRAPFFPYAIFTKFHSELSRLARFSIILWKIPPFRTLGTYTTHAHTQEFDTLWTDFWEKNRNFFHFQKELNETSIQQYEIAISS